MTIIRAKTSADPYWHRLVESHQSSAFHSPNWMQVLTDTYSFEVDAYIKLDERGEPTAGLPFVRITDMLGERIVSLPFSDYCDPLVSDSQDWKELGSQLLAEGCSATLRCLHNSLPLQDERFAAIKRAKWHGVNLQPELETLWSGLHESSRRAIHKARRNGVTVTAAEDKTMLRAFFEMHMQVRKYKYKLLTQPYRFFESIWHHFIEQQRGVLLLASYQDTIIGGTLFLEWQDKLYYKFNASNRHHLTHRPNDLLIWEGIKYGKSQGCTQLDFGLSDWNQEGLIRYKRKFASEEKEISFLTNASPVVPIEEEKQGRSLLPRLTELFTDETVPDKITEKGGDLLYKLFV